MSTIIHINKESGIPLIGLAFIGIIARNNNNIIQIRTTTLCNMNCNFCSTDAGPFSRFHKTQFIVDVNYMLEYLKELANYFNQDLIAHIDSVGEPLVYPQLTELIKGIKKIKQFKEISIVTNGTLLIKEKIKELEKAGLNKINLSIHSLNALKSQALFGSNIYNIEKIIELIKEIKKTNIDLYLTPVYIPNVNENDIAEIIKFAKELNCKVTIQKYETHKYGRKIKTKEQSYFHFYKFLENLEKRYSIKLRYRYSDLEAKKVNPLLVKFKKGEKINAEIKCQGWFSNQSVAVANNRALTIINCKEENRKNIKVKILETKDNIYLAEPLKQRIRI